MNPRLGLPLLFGGLLASRLCHLRIVWVEEAYPMAAALEMMRGRIPYRDFWFDKPPLSAAWYLLFGAQTGLPLRITGTMLIFTACLFAFLLARKLWSESEGTWAAGLLGFYLTFGIPSAVIPFAPDLELVAPHLLAVLLCAVNQPLLAGLVCGLAFGVNVKAIFVFAVCSVWLWRRIHLLLAGAALGVLPVVLWLTWHNALPYYVQQVWQWGFLYNANPPFEEPFREGVRRTLFWMGLHLTLVVGCASILTRDRRIAVWLGLSFAAVLSGWRFFPRYFFQLLAPACVAAPRGLTWLGWIRWPAIALLLVPLIRFAPSYVRAAADPAWSDLALFEDSRQVSDLLVERGAGSLFVWGYRPDIYALSRVPAGTPFLDSQPLTGVIADRHLTSSEVSAPELARHNRVLLVAMEPQYIVDGLGLMNPSLALTRYPELSYWMARYREVARTRYSIIYAFRSRVHP